MEMKTSERVPQRGQQGCPNAVPGIGSGFIDAASDAVDGAGGGAGDAVDAVAFGALGGDKMGVIDGYVDSDDELPGDTNNNTNINNTGAASSWIDMLNQSELGVKVKHMDQVGYALVADRPFTAGHVIFSDCPIVTLVDKAKPPLAPDLTQLRLFHCLKDVVSTCLSGYQHEFPETKADFDIDLIVSSVYTFHYSSDSLKKIWIHDFYAPMGDCIVPALMRTCVAACAVLPVAKSLFHSAADYCKAALVIIFNAHQHETEHCSVGLFPVTSYAAHGCLPNAVRRVNPAAEDEVTYVAVRDIHPGELICISYIEEEALRLPTLFRRRLLHSTKRFWCKCNRYREPLLFVVCSQCYFI
jgi:hypothetical protein